MNYQVGGNNQNKGIFGSAGSSGVGAVKNTSQSGSSILSRNSVGDLLACKLVKGGKEPVLDINGIQLKTRAEKSLENAKEGDTVYLNSKGR